MYLVIVISLIVSCIISLIDCIIDCHIILLLKSIYLKYNCLECQLLNNI